jgi:hypothetical protein
MRLSEKSIELNFCHQMSLELGEPIWWFGTTQAQEREAGWDVAGRVAGHWIRFQLKASREVLTNGARRFRGHHHQLVELRARAVGRPCSVFYVFPTIGTTAELTAAQFDLLPWLSFLDVNAIQGVIDEPTTAGGALRKSGLHYFDLRADHQVVTIHSDPLEVGTISVERLAGTARDLRNAGDVRLLPDLAGGVQDARAFLLGGRNRVAAFMPAV